MTLQPAFETTLVHGTHAVTLRASLRAAVHLTNIKDLSRLVTELAGQNFTTTRAVILATATDRQAAMRYLTATADSPLASYLPDQQAACLATIAALFKAGDDSAADAPSQGGTREASKPWADHFKDLYRFGTGWLGWPPETVWNAGILELTEAAEAHAERLIAMNGGSTTTGPSEAERQANIEAGLDPEFDRAGLARLKAMQ